MDLSNFIQGEELRNLKTSIKKIFFYRICGTGMGACACLLKDLGYEVEGADISFSPPMSDYLKFREIPCHLLSDFDSNKLAEYDLIIVGNSVPRNSDHAQIIEKSGTKFTSFPELLGQFFLKDKNVIGIAGTHGKTTTTFFLVQMFEYLGVDTGYLIGGIIDGRSPSKIGKDSYFVIEADEYDSAYFQKLSKFRLYEINQMILTSLEFDHADIFDTVEDIEDEFKCVFDNFSGKLVASEDYQSVKKLQKEYPALNWSTYGENSDFGPLDYRVENLRSFFSLKIDGKIEVFETNILGIQNILNLSANILQLYALNFDLEKIKSSILDLSMVKRRQEVRGKYQGAVVIDDFAHHPRAIELTISSIKLMFPKKKIITIFEPVSATARSSIFQNEFTNCFYASDKVILAKNDLKTTVKDSNNLDCNKIVKILNEKKIESMCAGNLSDLQTQISKWANEESVLLILSNRTCLGLWESEFINEIS